MSTVDARPDTDTSGLLRRGLLALAGLGVAGTLVELAILRHWKNASELIPWLVLIPVAALVAAMVVRPTTRVVRVARIAGLVLTVTAVYGVIDHVVSNFGTAPLDGVVGPTWDTLSLWSKVWMAATGGVGPAPPLAAGSLAPTGLALVLATIRHPVLVR